jgi:UDPglucose--hexose-1-phosphate uridylyltransferase
MTVSTTDLRVDPHLQTRVHYVGSRQARPNLPSSGCPFCPGGLEAPEAYDVRWFTNRWPAMPGDRCEVVLYTSDHDATFASLGVDGAGRVIDLWAQRTAELGARDDVDYVLVFENRGAEVGATMTHPHGQIYCLRPRAGSFGGDSMSPWRPDPRPGDRLVIDHRDGWRSWCRSATRSRLRWRALSTWRFSIMRPSTVTTPLPSRSASSKASMTRGAA